MPNLLTHLKHTLAPPSTSSSATTSIQTPRSPTTSPTIPPSSAAVSSKRLPSIPLPLPFCRKHTHTETAPISDQQSTSRSALRQKLMSTRETIFLAGHDRLTSKGRNKKKLTRLPLTEHNIGTLMGELSGSERAEEDSDDGDVVYEEERARRRKVEEMVARRERRERGVREWLEGVIQ